MTTLQNRRMIALVLIVAGIADAGVFAKAYFRYRNLLHSGVRTSGEVDYSPSGGVIRFRTPQSLQELRLQSVISRGEHAQPGDKVDLVYPPEHPEQAKSLVWLQSAIDSAMVGISGCLILSLIGAALYCRVFANVSCSRD